MTCPHCGHEHPDGIAFCPDTGEPLAAKGRPGEREGGRGTGPRQVEVRGDVEGEVIEALPAGASAGPPPRTGPEIVAEAVSLWLKDLVPFSLAAGVALLPMALVALVLSPWSPPDTALEPAAAMSFAMAALPRAILLSVAQGVVYALAAAALLPLIGDRLLEGNAEPLAGWHGVQRRLGPLLLAAALSSAITVLGLVACVVPGLIAIVLFAFVPVAVMAEDLDPARALNRSAMLVRQHFLRVAFLMLSFLAIWFASGLLLGGLGRFGAAVTSLMTVMLYPALQIALLLLYADIRRTSERVPLTATVQALRRLA